MLTTPTKLYLVTYNVRTLSGYEHLIELTEAFKNIKFDIIGMSETRRQGIKIQEYDDYILCHSGVIPGQYGVGFLVHKKHKNNIESFTGFTDRVAILNLNIQGNKISLIQVYAPTEAAEEDKLELFYENVNKALKQVHQTLIIMGDFNAKIGQPRRDEYLVTRPNGYGERNQRGQRLLDFALENKITILNTFFKKKPKLRWTWCSPNGHKNEIDFILTNQPKLIQNMEVLSVNFPSDHRPVRTTLILTKYKKTRSSYKNCTYSTLKKEEEISKYLEQITSYLPELDDCSTYSVQTFHDKIIKAISESLKVARITKGISHNRHNILSEQTLSLMERRQDLQNTPNKTRSMKNELSALYKLTKKRIKQDYTRYRHNIFEKHLTQSNSSKKAFKELQTYKTWIDGLNHRNKTLKNRNDVVNLATDFYKKLYSASDCIETEQEFRNSIKHQEEEHGPQLDVVDVVETIKMLKTDKSPGQDNITNEAIKNASAQLALPLTKLFNRILDTTEIPTQWSKSEIILIYKKGDPHDIGNYRPISLLPCLYKLFSMLINKKIRNTLDAEQPIEQAGFRKGFSTIDHIHTIELLIEKYQEQQKPLYIAYIDYKKAFDTVSHMSIWKTLKDQGVETMYIQIIKKIYENSTAKVKLDRPGPSFPIRRGVKQGDPLSPQLFIALLESIIRNLDWKQYGININGKYLNHLRFADDLILLSETDTQLQLMIHSLNKSSKQVGLEMNLTKTMIMTNSIQRKIAADDVILKYTDKYTYLGKQIGFSRKNSELEIDRRIQNTWNKYWSMKEIFKSDMAVQIKTRVMNTCLLPSLTYGCQTWKFTNKTRNKIISCQRALERSMLSIQKIQKIRHEKIRNISKATDALEQTQRLKWKWAGHVARLQDERWTKRVTLWSGPKGKRHRGRPHARWEDDITRIAGSNWTETAKDRDKWTSLEEAFTRRGVLSQK